MLLAFATSWGINLASALPALGTAYLRLRVGTFLFAFVRVGGTDEGAIIVDNDDALDVFVSLHAIEGFLDLRHAIK